MIPTTSKSAVTNGASLPASRLTINVRPANSDLALLILFPLYCYLVSKPGLPFSWLLLQIFALKSLELVALVYGLAIPIVAVRMFQTRNSPMTRRERFFAASDPYLTLDFLFRTYRRIWVILGAIFLFLHLKHLILFWNKTNYDLALWNLDRALHFGVQPNIWAIERFGRNDDFAVLLDWLYINYFKYKLIVSALFLTELCGKRLSDQYFLAYALLWLLGGLAYLAVPADGPCYSVLGPYSLPKEHHTHIFAFPVTTDIPPSYIEAYKDAKIWIAKSYQDHLWSDRRMFLQGKQFPGVFYGVAAMPSLHVAAMVMLMIFLFKASSIAGVLAAIYTALVFIGSITLQWHYAVDGYIGAIFAVLVTVFALKVPEFSGRPRAHRRRSEALSPDLPGARPDRAPVAEPGIPSSA